MTGAGSTGVFRVAAMEAALTKSFAPETLDNIAVNSSNLLGDIHADADYRAHLTGVMAGVRSRRRCPKRAGSRHGAA